MLEGVESGPGTLILHHHFGTVLYCSWGRKIQVVGPQKDLVLVLTPVASVS